jgi:glutathione S-transferase
MSVDGSLKLLWGSASGFSRKVRVVCRELSLEIEEIAINARNDAAELSEHNPLGKIPVLLVGDRPLYDSSVIVAYLVATYDTHDRFRSAMANWSVARNAALGDGLLEAGMLGRAEKLREPARQDAEAISWQFAKVARSLDWLERQVHTFAQPFDVGQIAIASALGWLEFRLPDLQPLADRPRLREWHAALSRTPSFSATQHA